MTTKTKSLTKTALFAALIAVGAFITIPMYPVPVTLQTFFVFMAGLLLTPAEAFSACFIYMALGLVGLPIFAGFSGGPQSIFVPSFGFIIGFCFSSALVAYLVRNIDPKDKIKIFMATMAGEILLYLIGLPYMYFALRAMGTNLNSLYAVLAAGLIPFIPGDLLKIIAAVIISPKVKNATM
ncbi:protein BioY [Peptoniphilus sp. ING2-D1G]|nr:protein BioY [Peptoniphilus sp. ING2-D1G]